jgi:hypothetical protein
MQTLTQLASIPAISVFLGTLPLLGAILWGLLQNERRLAAIDKRLDLMDKRLDGIDRRLDGVESKLERYGDKLNTVATKVAIIETKLDGPRLFTKG